MGLRAFALMTAAILLVPAASRAQEARSADLARQLTQLLDQRKLDSIAAVDAQNVDGFVAALYIPETQLLVVSAKYSAPDLLKEKLAKKEYRDIYIDLSSASIPATKLLVMDTFANGLVARPAGDMPPDSIERAGAVSTFDGNWKKAKQSETDYMKVFAEAESAYSRALQILIASLKSPGTLN
ncbi:MAG TPA: hypothetical protein VEL79_15895 [Vicinamibacterales bacterium]|nr:hypothetical protein [Vicinamibacterales bacterium]